MLPNHQDLDLSQARDLEIFLSDQIPLTSTLGVRVIHCDETRVELTCPLHPNRNHLGTAFGGSLATLAILASYAWLFRTLWIRGEKRVHVVLKSSHMDYLRPVPEDLRAICLAPSSDDFERFLEVFDKKGRARIQLASTIETTSGTACRLSGEFVAGEKPRASPLQSQDVR